MRLSKGNPFSSLTLTLPVLVPLLVPLLLVSSKSRMFPGLMIWGFLEKYRMLNTTLNYLDHFARFTQKENVEAVERLLSTHKNLDKFERAQLGT